MYAELPAVTEGFAVTIKAVIPCAGQILLLRKDNGRWDLPGGKLEPGESVIHCLRREVAEETGMMVEVDRIIDCWVRERPGKAAKFIVTYLCRNLPANPPVRVSDEHVAAACFWPEEVEGLPMLEGARSSVRTAMRLPSPF